MSADERDFEDRVRRRFHESASATSMSADAWEHIAARGPNRRPRRMLLPIVGVAVAAAALMLGAALLRGEDGRRKVATRGETPSAHSPAPVAHPDAFRGLGRLAFFDAYRLFVLDGDAATVRRMGPGGSRPAWSPDGEWLAYLRDGRAWIQRADGSGAQRVLDDVDAYDLTWCPTDAVLAVAGEGTLDLVFPGRKTFRVASSIGGRPEVAWSPDGTTLAYTEPRSEPGSDGLVTVSASGRDRHEVIPATADGGFGVALAGWSPDGGSLLAWDVVQHSASLVADGAKLEAVDVADGARHPVTTTLTNRGWLRWSPDGRQLLLVAGGDRSLENDKHLSVCDRATWACRPLPQPEGMNAVSLDPAWSPDGRRIAFVRGSGEAPPSRTLWVMNADGSDVHEVDGPGDRVASPTWSADGRTLLYVAGGTVVRLVDPANGQSSDVVGPPSAGCLLCDRGPGDELGTWYQTR